MAFAIAIISAFIIPSIVATFLVTRNSLRSGKTERESRTRGIYASLITNAVIFVPAMIATYGFLIVIIPFTLAGSLVGTWVGLKAALPKGTTANKWVTITVSVLLALLVSRLAFVSFAKWMEHRDPSNCLKRTVPHLVNQCFVEVAKAKLDPLVCRQSPDEFGCLQALVFDPGGDQQIPCDRFPKDEVLGNVFGVECIAKRLPSTEEQKGFCADLSKRDEPFEFLAARCFQFEPNWQSAKSGDSILMVALRGHPSRKDFFAADSIRTLFSLSPDLTTRNKQGESAVDLINFFQLESYLQVAKAQATRLNFQDPKGRTPLHRALALIRDRRPNSDAAVERELKEFVTAGADPTIPDNEGVTPAALARELNLELGR